MLKVKIGSTWTMYEICSKLTIKTQERLHVVLVSLLLSLNRFHKYVYYFHCWLWTSECLFLAFYFHLNPFTLLLQDVYAHTSRVCGFHQKMLSYITIIGCFMSLIGLFLTFLTYLMFRLVLIPNFSVICVVFHISRLKTKRRVFNCNYFWKVFVKYNVII